MMSDEVFYMLTKEINDSILDNTKFCSAGENWGAASAGATLGLGAFICEREAWLLNYSIQ